MARDNFSKRTVERLRSRVAQRCSNPDCRRQTAGPSTDPEGVNITGIAAHIHAASPGGPRYLASMSSVERGSIKNAIWLCSVCATLVDRDIEAYPAARLADWKDAAERLAAKELNTRPPSHGDASAQLVAALAGQSPTFLPSVINNAHEASAKVLERLDSRFRVESSYQGKTTTFTLNARERVPFKLLVPDERAPEWQAKVRSAIEDGLAFEIDASGVKAQGSPLLETLFNSGEPIQWTTIKVSPQSTSVRVKLTAVDLAGGARHAFDDIDGHLFMGQAGLTFKGELWEGLAELTIQLRHEGTPRNGSFSFNIDLDRWVGVDIRGLPYLPSITEFFRHVDAGEMLDVAVFWQGQQLLGLRANFDALGRETGRHSLFFAYLSRASAVLRALDMSVRLPRQVSIGENDFDELMRIHEIVMAPPKMGPECLSTNASFTLNATDNGENIQQLRKQNGSSVIMFKQTIQDEISIFGQRVRLPLISITFNSVCPRVLDDRQSFQAGDSVRVELEPAEGFWMSYQLSCENEDDAHSGVGHRR